MICGTLSDIEQIRDRICTDKNRTMLWSGARQPFGLFHQDGSPKLWKERDLEWAKRNNCENYDEIKVGMPVIVSNYYGEEISDFIAKENGKETLGQALRRLEIEIPEDNEDFWELLSQFWAENAQGEVGLSSGQTIQKTKIFARKEFSIIKANMKVTSIIVYDNYPVTAGGEKSRIYQRHEFERMEAHELCLYWRSNADKKRYTSMTEPETATTQLVLHPRMK